MILSPRYDGPPILSVDGHPNDQLEPLSRQRRRMHATLAELSAEQWASPSRCDGWTVRDVVAHLVGVNAFWQMSTIAGLAGAPTRVLGGFDPAATPPLMVKQLKSLTPQEMLEQFVSSNESFLAAVSDLTADGWSQTAESPAGHVSIRLLAQHALWDCWVHERDINLPLGVPTALEADELTSCLRYAAAVSPVLGMGLDRISTGTYAVDATDPDIRFVLEVGESVSVRNEAAEEGTPRLRGDAVALIEALSLRAPLPRSTPVEWSLLLDGLATAFDAV